jgi:hypothetical protein
LEGVTATVIVSASALAPPLTGLCSEFVHERRCFPIRQILSYECTAKSGRGFPLSKTASRPKNATGIWKVFVVPKSIVR